MRSSVRTTTCMANASAKMTGRGRGGDAPLRGIGAGDECVQSDRSAWPRYVRWCWPGARPARPRHRPPRPCPARPVRRPPASRWTSAAGRSTSTAAAPSPPDSRRSSWSPATTTPRTSGTARTCCRCSRLQRGRRCRTRSSHRTGSVATTAPARSATSTELHSLTAPPRSRSHEPSATWPASCTSCCAPRLYRSLTCWSGTRWAGCSCGCTGRPTRTRSPGSSSSTPSARRFRRCSATSGRSTATG
jgi:hypothetical protein